MVVAVLWVVHAVAGAGSTAVAQVPKGKRTEATGRAASRTPELPAPVAEMLDAFQAAIAAGDLEELRVPMQWNELPPETGAPKGTDPIAYWRGLSVDGEGRDILAALADVLLTPPAVVPGGKDVENNRLFVWPQFAEKQLGTLTPGEVVTLYRIVPPADARAMRETGVYTGWRLVIGADGTWHSFKKD